MVFYAQSTIMVISVGWSVKVEGRESKTIVFAKNASRYGKPVKLLED